MGRGRRSDVREERGSRIKRGDEWHQYGDIIAHEFIPAHTSVKRSPRRSRYLMLPELNARAQLDATKTISTRPSQYFFTYETTPRPSARTTAAFEPESFLYHSAAVIIRCL